MPAARSSPSKSRKSIAPSSHSTPKQPSSKSSPSRSNAAKRVACRAWWCDSTFTRRADMLKHVGLEHFGKRVYCILCHTVMKQDSNMNTHLNTHFGIHCTLCSCGRGFTDPSACTRHREATGHEKGETYGKVRPVVLKPIKIQHLAGLAIDLQMISDPNFVPPPFDESYHLKGMVKPKAQEKYNSRDYLITEPLPNIPSAHATGILPTDEAPAAEYQESAQIEHPAPTQTKIQVDALGINVNFSYDVELPREPQYCQVVTASVYTDCHESHATYPASHSQPPADDYYPPPEAIPPYHSYPIAAPRMSANANFYPQQHPGNYPMAINYFTPPSHPSVEPYVRPEYSEMPCNSQVPNPPFNSMPLPSLDMPPRHNFFGVGFDTHMSEQFQQPQFQPYHSNANFSNHAYQPALPAY